MVEQSCPPARVKHMALVPYEVLGRVWVEDGHVLLEGHDGVTLVMTPEVAIGLSRKLGKAGGDSLINRITQSHARDGPV